MLLRARRMAGLFVLGLSLAGCAGTAATDAELRAAADTEQARQPGFYRNGAARAFTVRREGKPVGLLWGTIHIGYGSETQLPRAIREKFYKAADLTVEVVADRMSSEDVGRLRQLLRSANETPDRAALAKLDPASRAALERAVPPGNIGHLSLRGLSNLVASQAAASSGDTLPVVGFVDLDLIGFARSQGTPVHGLETPQLPDPTIAQPNGTHAAETLCLTLRRADAMRQMGLWTRRAYASGEIADTLAVLTAWRATPADLERSDLVREGLLSRRNKAWIPGLEKTFAEPGFHFVAFGAGHLPGDDGVVSLLRARGFEVLPCPGDTCPG